MSKKRHLGETPTVFGHIGRMEDNGKLKTLMFGIVDGTNKRVRPWTTMSASVRLDYKS